MMEGNRYKKNTTTSTLSPTWSFHAHHLPCVVFAFVFPADPCPRTTNYDGRFDEGKSIPTFILQRNIPNPPVKQYSESTWFNRLYSDLTDSSLENSVDLMWSGILGIYFPGGEGFIVQGQTSPEPELLVTHYDYSDKVRTFFFAEDMAAAYETSSATWTQAADQLVAYIRNNWAGDSQNGQDTVYGSVNIGRYTRFYVLEESAPDLEDYPGTNGRLFELRRDEREIHQILCEIKHQALA